jgi:hypothetical protein
VKHAAETSDGHLASASELRDDLVFMKKAQTFQTPTKPKRTDTSASFEGPFDPNWEFTPHKRVLPDDDEDLEIAINRGDIDHATLATVVQEIESSLQLTGIAVEELADDANKRFKKAVELDIRLSAQ